MNITEFIKGVIDGMSIFSFVFIIFIYREICAIKNKLNKND